MLGGKEDARTGFYFQLCHSPACVTLGNLFLCPGVVTTMSHMSIKRTCFQDARRPPTSLSLLDTMMLVNAERLKFYRLIVCGNVSLVVSYWLLPFPSNKPTTQEMLHLNQSGLRQT